MPLTPGSRLGPYEILAPIGAGGMGEVYKATDTRLERTVAVKILPAHLSASPESRQRFEREAKTISRLSHPHICALHDVGSQDGIEYLVMEYLEGEVLSDRLARGPLPLEQTLRFGQEIADALDKAHRQGIVHRDLKPGNVMLTTSGVKLLDFGLAKAIAPASPASSLTSLPTQQGLTQQGTILGTFQYMAPEQLEGKDADARTDIWALGCVLYEMATGKKTFSGLTQASLIGAILHTEPQPISAMQPMSPPAFERVVKTCLAKDPEERWQSTADLKRELRWIAEGSQERPGVAMPPAIRRPRSRTAMMLAAALIGALVGGLGVRSLLARRPPSDAPKTAWLSIVVPRESPIASYGPHRVAFSPDGSRLVYALEHGGTTRLYLRALDQPEAVLVRDSENGISPFFSPDSRWLGFFTGSRLVKVPLEGGAPQTICETGEVRGATWGTDGTIVFSTGTSGLRRVPAAGGVSQLIATPDAKRGDVAFYWPQMLPGNESVLFTNFTVTPHVCLVSLKTGKRRDLLEGDAPIYFPTGHILFTRGSSLFAVPFDLARLELTGSAIALLDDVKSISPFRSSLFNLSSRGVLAYVPGFQPGHTLVLVDRAGKVDPLAPEPREYEEPRFSPDGKRLVFTVRSDSPDIWVLDIGRGSSVRLTFEEGEDETPIWTPDGSKVTFGGDRLGKSRKIFWKSSDGNGAEQPLVEGESHPHVNSWSPDGNVLVYTEFDPDTSGDLWIMTRGDQTSKRPWLRTRFNERAGRLSPDGRWIAYVSNESGRDEVYVQPFPGPGGKWQVSVSGGTEPVWAHSGREVFYRVGETMMSVQIAGEKTFSAETPRALFSGPFLPTRRGDAEYDVSPDDKRFVMIRRDERAIVSHLNIVLNFSEELKRVPVTEKP